MKSRDDVKEQGSNSLAEKSSIFINLLIALFIGSLFVFLLKGSFVTSEDFDQIFFTYGNFKELYISADHGCVVSWVFMKLVGSVIPLFFGVHPNDNLFGIVFRAVDFAFLIFLISKFASIFTTQKKMTPLYYVLAFGVFLLSVGIQETQIYDIALVYSRHFRYVFMMLFYLMFWLWLIKIFVNQELPKKRFLFFITSMAFFAGLSTEFVNISSVASLTLLVVFQMLTHFNKLKLSLSNFSVALKEYVGLYFPIIFFLLGVILFYSHPGFHWEASGRGVANFSDTFNSIIAIFPEFLPNWFNAVFVSFYHWILVLVAIILSVLVFLVSRDHTKNIRVVFSAWALIFGMAFFNFSLIAAGKTYYDTGLFWLVSPYLNVDSMIIFFASIFLLLGYCINKIVSTTKKESLVLGIFGFSILIFVTFVVSYLDSSKKQLLNYKNSYMQAREVMYKAEKMYVFYAEQKETALLPKSILNVPIIREEVLGVYSYSERLAPFIKPYYIWIYRNNIYVPIKLLPDDKAMQEFHSRGGVFDINEIKESKFTKLLDKDFVLNRKAAKR